MHIQKVLAETSGEKETGKSQRLKKACRSAPEDFPRRPPTDCTTPRSVGSVGAAGMRDAHFVHFSLIAVGVPPVPGQDPWTAGIHTAINSCDLFVVLLTERCLELLRDEAIGAFIFTQLAVGRATRRVFRRHFQVIRSLLITVAKPTNIGSKIFGFIIINVPKCGITRLVLVWARFRFKKQTSSSERRPSSSFLFFFFPPTSWLWRSTSGRN